MRQQFDPAQNRCRNRRQNTKLATIKTASEASVGRLSRQKQARSAVMPHRRNFLLNRLEPAHLAIIEPHLSVI
jgi:hypothetical protein